MAKRTFAFLGQTYTAQALSATLTNATYGGIKGGSSTQLIDILEVMISGQSSTSTLGGFLLCRVSTIAATETTLALPNSDGPNHPATAALAAPPITFVAATTGPFASSATGDAKIQLGLNSFGGIVRWSAAPTQQFSILGQTANLGEAVVFNCASAFGASAAANSHIIYEPY